MGSYIWVALVLIAITLIATGCARYDPMPKWTGYSLEARP